MRSFLLKNNCPIVSWGSLPPDTMFEGDIPEEYDLAINPHHPYIIVDVDRHSEDKDGFANIPKHLEAELNGTFNYPTKRNGRHFWFYYTGDKVLLNKASNLGIDLRIGYTVDSEEKVVNNGGYIKWHPRNTMNIVDELWSAKPTSKEMNQWLESIFS